MKKTSLISLVIIQAAILLLSACGQKGPLPPADKIPPKVSLISPTNGAQNVPVNSSIMITFSEDMAASTINGQTITISTGNGNVQGSVSYAGMTAVFKPASDLNPETMYTVTVDGSVTDEAGNAMVTPYGYIFVTGTALDTTPPGVSATNPAEGAVNVAPNAALSITFSEPVDQSTITFVLSVGSVTVPGTTTYSGTTAIFTPSTMLAYGTQYTVAVNAGVKDLAGNPMPSDYGWTFTTGAQADAKPPSVIANAPGIGATNVSVNTSLNVTFSEAVNQSTIAFTLSAGSTAVPCTMTYSGATAIFTPASPLSYNTVYTATVNSGVKDLAGNAMISSYFWSFTTGVAPDTTPPSVSATNPADGALNVPPNAALSVTFTEPVDQSTIAFVLRAGSATVPCTMTYAGTTAIFTPSTGLAYGTQYTAAVKAGVKDLSGNAMPSDYGWTFATGAQPDTTPPSVTVTAPGIGATDVSINTSLTITFSEAVDQSTITFTLITGSTAVPCTMMYSGTTAVFTPVSPLSYNILYTATVNSGVEDLAGNPMPKNYSWSFKTEQKPTFTITANAGANGSISPSGSVSVNNGASQTFTITPSANYHITDVQVDGVSAGAVMSYTFTNVTADHTISASFATDTFTVTPSVNGGHGTISPATPQTVNFNGTTSFTLTPNTGYTTIMGGTCGGSLVGNTYTTNAVTASCSVIASFSINTNTITAGAGANGSISPSGSVAVNYGGSQTFTITPNVGYRVLSVLVDGVSVGAVTTYTFTNVTAAHTISATFAINSYTVTASVSGGNGSISPATPQTVNFNGTTSFTLTPNTGYAAIMGGTCGGSLVGNTYTTNAVTANCSVIASFSLNTSMITASAGANGSISPSGSVAVNYGGSQTFTITPNVGYHVLSVLVDGAPAGAVTTYTFTNVTAAHTISATFAINTYTITASAGSGGSINPSGSVTVNYGTSQTFTFTPNNGYHVSAVTVDGSPVGLANSYTFTNVTAPHTLSVNFDLNSYIITVSPGPGGTIAPAGPVLVSYGGNRTFTITPNTGYHTVDVLVDSVSIGAQTSYTFTNVTTDHAISASFAINTFTVTPSVSGGNGTISPTAPQTVNYNGTTSFTLSPSTGYHAVMDGTCGGTLSGNGLSYTTNSVTANCTVTASFAVSTYTVTPSVSGGNGTISPTAPQTVNYNGTTSFTLSPSTGYHAVMGGTCGGTLSGDGLSYITNQVKADCTVVAGFVVNTYTVTPSVSGGHGSISPNTVQTVNYNGTTSFTLNPNIGYDAVVSGTCGGTLSGDGLSYTTNPVTANCTVTASFAVSTYTVTPSVSGGNGTISPMAPQTVNYNGTTSFTLSPSTGYHAVMGGTCGGTLSGDELSYRTNQVKADCTVVAGFVVNTYTVTPSVSGGHGSISPNTGQTVNYNGTTSFTLTPNTGYHAVISGTCGGTLSGDGLSYTTNPITGNCTVAASFAINTYTITATAGIGGTINPAGAVVNYGGSQTFAITPDAGYAVDVVLVDGNPVVLQPDNTYTFSTVTAAHTISASFI